MNVRGVFALGLIGGTFAVLVACSSADPNTVNYEERVKSDNSSSGSTDEAGTSSGGTEGGTSSGGTDAGKEAAGPINAFSGAPAFDATTAAMTQALSMSGSHAFAGNNPVDQPCLTCHVAGGMATNNPWMFGGTAYTSAAATTVLKFAEIRIVDKTGALVGSAYSDPLGNFWTDFGGAGIPDGAKVGIRNATGVSLMNTPLTTTSGSCSQTKCHITGGQGKLFTPP